MVRPMNKLEIAALIQQMTAKPRSSPKASMGRIRFGILALISVSKSVVIPTRTRSTHTPGDQSRQAHEARDEWAEDCARCPRVRLASCNATCQYR